MSAMSQRRGWGGLSKIDCLASHFTVYLRTDMTPEERQRMMYLCRCMQDEQDRAKFMTLVTELNELLARKEHRLELRDQKPKTD